MYCQSEEMQADCLSKNASTLFLPLAFLRVSALPELNYTALANEASVYGIAQYHAILSSAARTTAMLCSVVNISAMKRPFTQLHSIMQYLAALPEQPRYCAM
jgi:hypothetical protein